jgi:hypothetical protein
MVQLADKDRIREFLRALSREAEREARLYLTGGATAVLYGWRPYTIDLDIKLVPEDERLLRALPVIAERLGINVERSCPGDYLPELEGWEDRSPLAAREGRLACHHYDLCAQALAKIARGHVQDMADIEAMLSRGLVAPPDLREHLRRIEPRLHLFPAINAASLRLWVEEALASSSPKRFGQ